MEERAQHVLCFGISKPLLITAYLGELFIEMLDIEITHTFEDEMEFAKRPCLFICLFDTQLEHGIVDVQRTWLLYSKDRAPPSTCREDLLTCVHCNQRQQRLLIRRLAR